MSDANKYCLDANILIKAWREYYSPKFCPDYWDILNVLGASDRIFIPSMVRDEITRTEDDLKVWLEMSKIPIREITTAVTNYLTQIFDKDETHRRLVDNTKQRSLADPWVIAHAMHEQCCVVTRESKETSSTKRIKIPNVCENMGVRWINDFALIEELGIKFRCEMKG
jgi:predicted nucleic acid-binding protein